ncbi:uncharacterized protein LOC126372800 isoform X2 [Pectinophora gossypiella]|uniref:uncharacterized protein LOC126372800 isoform X2 n=1 Tax=Pectinophora gossypiella TaxID=13191 RepID=UPI00214E133B|nr:uncharacterized protein LOC126372800 isoform X2 [Pectinophora gossypiella]
MTDDDNRSEKEAAALASGMAAKRHFKKLRDCHREAIRRRKYATGSAAANMKPWKYEAEMAFLLPHIEFQNILTAPVSAEEAQHFHEQSTTETSDNVDTESPPLSLEVSLATTDTENRKRRKLDETATQISQERREQWQHQRDEFRRPQDALATLFESLYQKTRELPKYLQLRVQREIFESVTRAEEEALDPISTYLSPTSSTSSYECAGARNHQASPATGGSTGSKQPTLDVKSEKLDRCYIE